MDWLLRLYIEFNTDLFNGECPSPTFTINRSRKAIIHFQPPAVLEVGSMATKASLLDAITDLLHCLVHAHNHSKGVLDHTPHNQYHNQRFAEKATSIGLYVARHKARGWSETFVEEKSALVVSAELLAPDDASKAKLADLLAKLAIPAGEMEALSQQVRLATDRATKQYSFKYICRCKSPHNAVRTGRRPESENALDATCNRCKAKFTLHKR